MKKNILKMMALALLCVGLTACGGNSSNGGSSDIPSDGVLGEYGPELYEMVNEYEITLRNAEDSLFGLALEKQDEKIGKKYKEVKERRIALLEEIKKKAEEASEALRGKEIATMIVNDGAIKVVEPFKIKSISGCLSMVCECTVELTEECPIDPYSDVSNKIKIYCQNDSNVNIPSAGYIKEVCREGDISPNSTCPVGTRFKITKMIEIGATPRQATQIKKGLFTLHHLAILWLANQHVLRNGKLGPIEVGKPIDNIPNSVNSLYDKFEHKTEKHEDDMDGEWVEDYYLFSYKGKNAFRVDIMEGKAYSISLLEGSTNIKTQYGYQVGNSARNVSKGIDFNWVNDYAGWVFCTSQQYTYFVSSEELENIKSDVPHKPEDFKESAKVARITYSR